MRDLHYSPAQKVFEQQQQWILALRQERKLGVQRIQHELKRFYDFHFSIDAIDDILRRQQVPKLHPAKRRRNYRRHARRASTNGYL